MEIKKPVPINALAKISPRPVCSTERTVRERLARLSELIRKDGAAYPLTPVLVGLWIDAFADLTPQQVDAAFSKAERSLKAFWPSPGEVRAFISTAEASAAEAEAAERWEIVRAYAVKLSPDYPEKNPPRIRPRTQQAIAAAGGLDRIRDCDADALVWCRKEFIKSYVRWGELEQGQYLLPDGEIKNLLKEAARQLSPPGSAKYKLLEEQAKQIEARNGV